jgi:Uma2 family endonuclease
LLTSAEEVQIMGMPAPHGIATIAELLALPDDGLRHELLDGEHVVTPAPTRIHQRALAELYYALRQELATRADVETLFSPADIQLGPRTLLQPDLFVLPRGPEGTNREWKDAPLPFLAVEVLSRATAARDRGKKRRLYLEAGVEEYWIVDLDARLVERWRPGDERPEIVHDSLAWSLQIGVSGTIDLPELFKRIEG